MTSIPHSAFIRQSICFFIVLGCAATFAVADDKLRGGEDVTSQNTANVDAEELKVKDESWGQLTIPATAAVGEQIQPQVKFAEDAITEPMALRFDLHGFVGGQRVGVIAHGTEVAIGPGDTEPSTGTLTVPEREGLERVAVVVYVGPSRGGWEDRVYSTEEIFDVSP